MRVYNSKVTEFIATTMVIVVVAVKEEALHKVAKDLRFLYCKSLHSFEQSDECIRTLWEEVNNERMYFITFMDVSQPK